MDDVDEILAEFLAESHENLDQMDQDLLALEARPGARDLLASIFRTVHTLKGTSGFLALEHLERLTHAGETVLVQLRDGHRAVDRATTDVLLELGDAVRRILAEVARTGSDAGVPVDHLVARLDRLADPGAGEEDLAGHPVPATDPGGGPVASATDPAGHPATHPARDTAPAVADTPTTTGVPDPTDVAATAGVPTTTGAPATTGVPVAADAPAGPPAATPGDMTVRTRVELLDTLMDAVAELVVLRNTIGRLAESGADPELGHAAQRLSALTGTIQDTVVRTRMQPLESLWSTLPRLVREVAGACGRQVELTLSGGDTEADRSLIEAVRDPLTHLVRNAVDHGIEPPEERLAAGKPAAGTLTIRALHSRGYVVIEVADDGRGVDTGAVARKAVEQGLRSPEDVAAMSPAQILQLLFLPGFSTADHLTRVSGRGVGMDVVRSKVEAVGGTVDFDSHPGRGTTWHLRIPLTVAIVPVLTVACAGQVFALPQLMLRELLRVTEADVHDVGGAPVHHLRGELLPLVRLRQALGLPAGDHDRQAIVVLKSQGRRFGLVVDSVLGTGEHVLSPLSHGLRSLTVYTGATILGDGRVVLVLDVRELALRAHPGTEGLPPPSVAARPPQPEAPERLLVARLLDGRRVAVPLLSVTRIERVPADRVEQVGQHDVLRLGTDIVPLAHLDRLLGAPGASSAREELLVVVHRSGDRHVGLVVHDVVDVLDDAEVHSPVEDTGLHGSAIVGEHVTGLLDGAAIVRAVEPAYYGGEPADLVDVELT